MNRLIFFLVILLSVACTKQKTVYILADEANGLELGAKVVSKGVEIGEVSFFNLTKEGDVVIETKLNPELEIPVDSKFRTNAVGNTSTMQIALVLGNDAELLQDKDTIDMRSLLDRTLDNLIDTAKDKLLDELSNSEELDSLQGMLEGLFK